MQNTLMAITVFLSSGRNILSKDIGRHVKTKQDFFQSQSLLFLGGMALIFILNPMKTFAFSFGILMYALIYGAFLVSSQWLFTFSMKTGDIAVCSLVYSFGFIFPTVSGALIWEEAFGFTKYVGIVLIIICILLFTKKEPHVDNNKRYLPPLIMAMFSSGGLGVMQKVQQKSDFHLQTNAFLFFAFLFAFGMSFIAYCITRKSTSCRHNNKLYMISVPAGICFGGANYINTILAGMMESSVFFPFQNIATLVLSAILGMIIFKEKASVKKLIGFAVGIAAIVILKL